MFTMTKLSNSALMILPSGDLCAAFKLSVFLKMMAVPLLSLAFVMISNSGFFGSICNTLTSCIHKISRRFWLIKSQRKFCFLWVEMPLILRVPIFMWCFIVEDCVSLVPY